MGKSNHFFGQPLYGQLIKLIDKEKVLDLSRSKGGERYIKRFDAWTHLVTMVRLTLMYYVNLFSLLNNPEKDWLNLFEKASIFPPEPS